MGVYAGNGFAVGERVGAVVGLEVAVGLEEGIVVGSAAVV